MKIDRFVVGACLACVLVLALMFQPGTQAKSDVAGLKIGVIDLQKVVNVHPTKVALEKELDAQRDNADAELKEMVKEMGDLVKELEVLDQKADAAKKKRLMIAEKRAKLAVRKASAEYEYVERYKNALQVVFDEVLNDVEGFRKAVGCDLIINVDNEPLKTDPVPSIDMIQRKIARKVVLASNGTLDLTDKAIEYIKTNASK